MTYSIDLQQRADAAATMLERDGYREQAAVMRELRAWGYENKQRLDRIHEIIARKAAQETDR